MKQITITIEYVYEKLKTIYEKRYYHNDYQKMHKKQLNLITGGLGIEDLIIFNIETKQFEFNLIDKNYINMGKLVLFTDPMLETSHNFSTSHPRTIPSGRTSTNLPPALHGE